MELKPTEHVLRSHKRFGRKLTGIKHYQIGFPAHLLSMTRPRNFPISGRMLHSCHSCRSRVVGPVCHWQAGQNYAKQVLTLQVLQQLCSDTCCFCPQEVVGATTHGWWHEVRQSENMLRGQVVIPWSGLSYRYLNMLFSQTMVQGTVS